MAYYSLIDMAGHIGHKHEICIAFYHHRVNAMENSLHH